MLVSSLKIHSVRCMYTCCLLPSLGGTIYDRWLLQMAPHVPSQCFVPRWLIMATKCLLYPTHKVEGQTNLIWIPLMYLDHDKALYEIYHPSCVIWCVFSVRKQCYFVSLSVIVHDMCYVEMKLWLVAMLLKTELNLVAPWTRGSHVTRSNLICLPCQKLPLVYFYTF